MYFVFRGFKWIFRKDWYGLVRYRTIQEYGNNERLRIIDVGFFSIVFPIKEDISKVARIKITKILGKYAEEPSAIKLIDDFEKAVKNKTKG